MKPKIMAVSRTRRYVFVPISTTTLVHLQKTLSAKVFAERVAAMARQAPVLSAAMESKEDPLSVLTSMLAASGTDQERAAMLGIFTQGLQRSDEKSSIPLPRDFDSLLDWYRLAFKWDYLELACGCMTALWDMRSLDRLKPLYEALTPVAKFDPSKASAAVRSDQMGSLKIFFNSVHALALRHIYRLSSADLEFIFPSATRTDTLKAPLKQNVDVPYLVQLLVAESRIPREQSTSYSGYDQHGDPNPTDAVSDVELKAGADLRARINAYLTRHLESDWLKGCVASRLISAQMLFDHLSPCFSRSMVSYGYPPAIERLKNILLSSIRSDGDFDPSTLLCKGETIGCFNDFLLAAIPHRSPRLSKMAVATRLEIRTGEIIDTKDGLGDGEAEIVKSVFFLPLFWDTFLREGAFGPTTVKLSETKLGLDAGFDSVISLLTAANFGVRFSDPEKKCSFGNVLLPLSSNLLSAGYSSSLRDLISAFISSRPSYDKWELKRLYLSLILSLNVVPERTFGPRQSCAPLKEATRIYSKSNGHSARSKWATLTALLQILEAWPRPHQTGNHRSLLVLLRSFVSQSEAAVKESRKNSDS